MKTTLFTVALLFVSYVCNAQRFLELTNGSWNNPNLSVETFDDFVISGFTETNAAGVLAPTFKVSNANGGLINCFRVDYSSSAILMDFTIKEATHSIILTGMFDVPPGAMPYKMFVSEVDMITGALIQSSLEYTFSGTSMIPHQVIYSNISNQAMIVGTELMGPIDPNNFAFVPKSGFVLALDLNNFNNIMFTHEMDMPGGNYDYDMLENITEVPGSNYFISGSCNGPSGEQNLFTMGVDYGGTILFSHVIDKTNFRNAGSSVMYYAPLNTVYLMANNSIMHQFQIARCSPTTGLFATTGWTRHQITAFPIGGGVDQNGFRLQQTPNKQIVIGGYLSAPNGAMPQQLTPFQMVLRDNLAFLAAKVYQSGNNSPLSPSYFEENGNSVFINTPDMIAYNKTFNRTYLVNQNTVNAGFDLNISSLLQPSKCEKAVQVTTYTDPHNIIGTGNFNPLPMYANPYNPHEKNRACSNIVLCQYPPASSIVVNTPGVALLSPNPASSKLVITLEEETIQSVLVYDMKGNRVLSQKGAERASNEMTLGIEKLDQGAYIVEITSKEGVVYRERFVKE